MYVLAYAKRPEGEKKKKSPLGPTCTFEALAIGDDTDGAERERRAGP